MIMLISKRNVFRDSITAEENLQFLMRFQTMIYFLRVDVVFLSFGWKVNCDITYVELCLRDDMRAMTS